MLWFSLWSGMISPPNFLKTCNLITSVQTHCVHKKTPSVRLLWSSKALLTAKSTQECRNFPLKYNTSTILKCTELWRRMTGLKRTFQTLLSGGHKADGGTSGREKCLFMLPDRQPWLVVVEIIASQIINVYSKITPPIYHSIKSYIVQLPMSQVVTCDRRGVTGSHLWPGSLNMWRFILWYIVCQNGVTCDNCSCTYVLTFFQNMTKWA